MIFQCFATNEAGERTRNSADEGKEKAKKSAGDERATAGKESGKGTRSNLLRREEDTEPAPKRLEARRKSIQVGRDAGGKDNGHENVAGVKFGGERERKRADESLTGAISSNTGPGHPSRIKMTH